MITKLGSDEEFFSGNSNLFDRLEVLKKKRAKKEELRKRECVCV